MEHSGISSLSRLQLPPSSRLHYSSCCPDKDLIVVFSRLGGKDRMSLWKMQGSKKWEVDLDVGSTAKEEVVDLAWSPDCQTVVLIHDPPRISCHSIQDGREERSVAMTKDFLDGSQLRGIWWFVDDKKPPIGSIPDIFKRRDIITGSTHSVLKMLPLLDALKDDSQSAGTQEFFAFQGAQSKSSVSNVMPAPFKQWPVLPSDPLTASVQPSKRSEDIHEEDLDELDDLNCNSILAVADSSGCIQCFLDGSYPLGTVLIDTESTIVSLVRRSQSSVLHAFQRWTEGDYRLTTLLPTEVDLTLLGTQIPRDVAKMSSTAWQLLWYSVHVVDDLRNVWMGSNTQTGAREPGLKWLSKLQDLEPSILPDTLLWAKLDLIHLLATERSSEAISDFIGAGEQMSERGLLKWDSTVTSALTRLRDQSQQYVAPACQRLHLVLEEVLAWAQLPNSHGLCRFDEVEIRECLSMVRQAIIASSWLAAVARRELSRFKEFMKWLRFEINNTAATNDHVLHPRHDVLEVQSYISYGLIDNPIDIWFVGRPPTNLSPNRRTTEAPEKGLTDVMERARQTLRDPAETSLHRPVGHHPLDSVDRNLHVLLHNLAERCSGIFLRAASATARSALCVRLPPPHQPATVYGDLIIREWTILGRDDSIFGRLPRQRSRSHMLCVAFRRPPGHCPDTYFLLVCLFRLQFGQGEATSPVLASIVLDCALSQRGGNTTGVQLLGVEFFDDECLVVVARNGAIVASVGYSNLPFALIHEGESLIGFSREGLAWETIERRRAGEFAGAAMEIRRSCAMQACKSENILLSVNGRLGRRVACVLDVDASIMEVFDLEADGEEDENEEE
ncbi:anaphase-promoting complex, cyclosome, subunit 4-domain-containing protein [Vararia minispora EC-137]|uniref:Anaphase-promoting complex, cyclosome, subunit 4-domain-containing protein n=1 Tax=Vararia minispora EC-137 TaxID=1314806 RepID=A0ACB8QMU3_9AGAM|nr:anaphase-promoting complex, cyclosome, subunit 4-domain-containing protein [Vararia minispora EC-137]